jgi:hypothetical protein
MRTACYRLLLVVIWISGAVLALGYLLHDGPALKLLLVSGAFMTAIATVAIAEEAAEVLGRRVAYSRRQLFAHHRDNAGRV